ncbi:MAG: NAD(P)H-binding protein, partial [Prevotellaceae bacterium]|nr:NAD(P)H-binding protein [Prevotellaceae bacterium]
MKAFVLGATGAVGRDLVEQLLADGRWERVDVAVRRPLAVEHEKLRVHVVDFDEPEVWTPLVTGDVLFICMGTT